MKEAQQVFNQLAAVAAASIAALDEVSKAHDGAGDRAMRKVLGVPDGSTEEQILKALETYPHGATDIFARYDAVLRQIRDLTRDARIIALCDRVLT